MKKYILVLFIFAFVLLNFKFANADDSGCIGSPFSSTTGVPCSTSNSSALTIQVPTPILPPGCTSTVGWSTTTADTPCNTTQQYVSTTPTTVTTVPVYTPVVSAPISTYVPSTAVSSTPVGCISDVGFSTITGALCNTSNSSLHQQIVPQVPTSILPLGGTVNTSSLNTTTSIVPVGDQINFDNLQVPGYKIHGCAGVYNQITTKDYCAYTVDGSNSGKLYTYTQILNFIKNGCISDAGYSTTTGLACDGSNGNQSTQQSVNTTPTTSMPTVMSVSTNTTSTVMPVPIDVPVSTPTTPTSISATIPSSTCTISSTLKIGSTGNDVACLQSHIGLISDGNFGLRTQIAVKAFQTYAGLKADGVVGPKSIAALEVGN